MKRDKLQKIFEPFVLCTSIPFDAAVYVMVFKRQPKLETQLDTVAMGNLLTRILDPKTGVHEVTAGAIIGNQILFVIPPETLGDSGISQILSRIRDRLYRLIVPLLCEDEEMFVKLFGLPGYEYFEDVIKYTVDNHASVLTQNMLVDTFPRREYSVIPADEAKAYIDAMSVEYPTIIISLNTKYMSRNHRRKLNKIRKALRAEVEGNLEVAPVFAYKTRRLITKGPIATDHNASHMVECVRPKIESHASWDVHEFCDFVYPW